MDKEKLISVLKKYEERISDKDFDLEAWKSSAINFLSRIFGERNSKVAQLESLKIDYSSWALRDAPSTYHPMETCKRKAREIIQSAIEEIDIFGPLQPRSMRSILAEVYSEDELGKINTNIENKDLLRQALEKAGKGKNVDALVQILLNFPMD